MLLSLRLVGVVVAHQEAIHSCVGILERAGLVVVSTDSAERYASNVRSEIVGAAECVLGRVARE